VSPRTATCRPLVVDHYDSYTGSLVDLVARAAGTEPTVVQHDRADLEALLTAGYTHIVLSPGPGHPDDPRDFRIGKQILARAEVPVLGVCLGHQGIVSAFGGTVTRAVPAHGVVSPVHHDESTLFRGLPSPFPAVRYHSLAATALPECLHATAWCDWGDGVSVMAVQHTSRPIFGVQFHPESVLTEHGARLIENFLDLPVASRDDRPTVRSLPWMHPEDLFRRVQDRERAFWLDGEGRAEPGERFSYIGWLRPEEPSLTFDASSGTVHEHRGRESRAVGGDIFDVLDGVSGVSGVSGVGQAGADLPFAFTGGWVGYLGYACRTDLPARTRADAPAPDACLLGVQRFLAFDHEQQMLYAASSDPDPAEWFAEVEGLLARPPVARDGGAAMSPPRVTTDVGPQDYATAFGKVRRALLAGDSYETNLTYRVEARAEVDPPDAFRRLRALGPAPYAALVRHHAIHVVSMSPERFVAVDAEGVVESRPIKGTTPRSADPVADAALARSLATEPRFTAENLMVTDLVRHDLAGICARGSVEVPALMRVESYPNVHQLVTTVRGRLRDDVSTVRAIETVFPPASMTGAPKRRTMELIAEVESSPRGVYSGAVGWIGRDGRADLGVTIRTFTVVGDSVQLGTGGAVTVQSDAATEYDETRWKVAHLFRVLFVGKEPAPVASGSAELAPFATHH
jgi:para-aminobenzoate synthetase